MGELIPCNYADCNLIRRDLRARIEALEEERAADVYVLLDIDEDDNECFVAVFRSVEDAEAKKVELAKEGFLENPRVRSTELRALAGKGDDRSEAEFCQFCGKHLMVCVCSGKEGRL